MTTKNDYSFLKDQQKAFANNLSHNNDNGSRYSNLNLNQNYKCPVLIPALSKTFKDKCNQGKINYCCSTTKIQNHHFFMPQKKSCDNL